MKYLGEYIREAIEEDQIKYADVVLGKRLGVSRQAVFEALKKLDVSFDKWKLFNKYMEALGRTVDYEIKVNKKLDK